MRLPATERRERLDALDRRFDARRRAAEHRHPRGWIVSLGWLVVIVLAILVCLRWL